MKGIICADILGISNVEQTEITTSVYSARLYSMPDAIIRMETNCDNSNI